MPEFLAETCAPGTAARRVGEAALALVCLRYAIAVPQQETCFCLYRAPSAGAVRAAMTRARPGPTGRHGRAQLPLRPGRRSPGTRSPSTTSSEPFSQEASTMTMICQWVPADDGALVMAWTTAEDRQACRGPGGKQALCATGSAARAARALAPALDGKGGTHAGAGAGCPARDQPAAIPGVPARREPATR